MLQVFVAVWRITLICNTQGFYLVKLDVFAEMITLEVAKNIGI